MMLPQEVRLATYGNLYEPRYKQGPAFMSKDQANTWTASHLKGSCPCPQTVESVSYPQVTVQIILNTSADLRSIFQF